MRRARKLGAMVAAAWLAALGGCTLTTSLDGLSDGKRPLDGGVDADASSGGGSGGAAPDGGCEAAYVAAVLSDKPVLFQRLNDTNHTALNSSGPGLDGTYGSLVTRGQPGLLGEACGRTAGFGGGDVDYAKTIQTPQDSRLQFAEAFTLEAWFKMKHPPKMNSDNNNPAILAYGDDGSRGAVYTMDIYNIGPYINFYLTLFPKQQGDDYDGISLHGMTPLEADTVYYAAATYDGEHLNVYLNGERDIDELAAPGPVIGYKTAGLGIGADAAFTGRLAFDGTIGNVAIYDKALTPDRIKAHFRAAGQ